MEVVTADMTKLDFKDPLVNLLCNIMGGLQLSDLTEEEKDLLKERGIELNL